MFNPLRYLTPLLRNYSTGVISKSAASLILKYDDWDIHSDRFMIQLDNDHYSIYFWNRNKWYAWFSDGGVTNKQTGKLSTWVGECLPRILMWRVVEHIGNIGAKNI